MKLLVLTVNKNDSTSFYRANGVLHDLKNQMPLEITSMNFSELKDMSWANLVLFDAVFMQRPYQSVALKMSQYCRELNLPIWVDFDDYLLDIPADNRSHALFNNPQTKETIVKILQLANVVTVSTHALKKGFSEANQNIHVIPNAFNTKLFNYRQNKVQTEKTMLWRGSETHSLDLFFYGDEIYSNQQKFTDWNFLYFGWNPWFIPHTENRKHIGPTDPVLYFRQVHGLSPRAMHVPLVDSFFNRCKSNIAYIEGSFAGAVCLVPEWEEWTLPGAITYKNAAEYHEKMNLMLTEKVNFKKYNALAWEFIMDSLTLEKVNKQRVQILQNLVS